MTLSHTQAVLLTVAGITIAAAAVGGATIGLGGGQPLQIDAVETTATADSDAVLTVEATLNNTGASNVSRAVELRVDANGNGTAATTVATRTVTVPSGTTQRVSFTVSPETVDPGPLTYAVVAGQDPSARANGTVTLDGPTFAVTDATSPSVVRGEQAEVSATLDNEGQFRGAQPVKFRLDRNHDGEFSPGETVATTSPVIAPGDSTTVEFTVDTEGLQPGTYVYRLVGPVGASEGTVTVLQPATFQLEEIDAPAADTPSNVTTVTDGNGTTATGNATTATGNGTTATANATDANATIAPGNATDVVRGEVVEFAATVRNDGDVAGTETVRFEPPEAEGEPETREIRLEGDSEQTLRYTVNTSALARGNYSVDVAMANQTESVPLRVRESNYQVLGVGGEETLTRGEDMQFEAAIENRGDAPANRSITFNLDFDDDDAPEYSVERTVALDPGERTTIQFNVTYEELQSNTSEQLLGAHVYSISSGDDEFSAAVAYEPPEYDSSASGTSDSSDEVGPASLDEITQAKYGLDYDQVSGETKRQVSEIHERQPFAEGLVLTEVRTREEIARIEYDVDVEPGETFNFTALDIETQQEVEAAFDAQFQSDTGDRIDSWDELARQQYGSDYDSLTDDRKQEIREQYTQQFEE